MVDIISVLRKGYLINTMISLVLQLLLPLLEGTELGKRWKALVRAIALNSTDWKCLLKVKGELHGAKFYNEVYTTKLHTPPSHINK